MSEIKFWNLLKENWSTTQIQANNSKFDSDLLKMKMNQQINKAKEIRKSNYLNDEFLDFS